MYFVVFVLQVKRHYVVPATWLRDIRLYTEKFVNNGLNSNQTYMVYWTENEDAFEFLGLPPKLPLTKPRLDFPADPNASTASIFPKEGWYACRVVKFKGNANFARNFASKYVNLKFAI